MATLAHSPSLTRPSTGLRRLLARLAEAFKARRATSAALRDLHRMETRDLHDLGITTYDFDAIARGQFRR
jgi:uncharacterized protein YjiS (DUF1127 family)